MKPRPVRPWGVRYGEIWRTTPAGGFGENTDLRGFILRAWIDTRVSDRLLEIYNRGATAFFIVGVEDVSLVGASDRKLDFTCVFSPAIRPWEERLIWTGGTALLNLKEVRP